MVPTFLGFRSNIGIEFEWEKCWKIICVALFLWISFQVDFIVRGWIASWARRLRQVLTVTTEIRTLRHTVRCTSSIKISIKLLLTIIKWTFCFRSCLNKKWLLSNGKIICGYFNIEKILKNFFGKFWFWNSESIWLTHFSKIGLRK